MLYSVILQHLSPRSLLCSTCLLIFFIRLKYHSWWQRSTPGNTQRISLQKEGRHSQLHSIFAFVCTLETTRPWRWLVHFVKDIQGSIAREHLHKGTDLKTSWFSGVKTKRKIVLSKTLNKIIDGPIVIPAAYLVSSVFYVGRYHNW